MGLSGTYVAYVIDRDYICPMGLDRAFCNYGIEMDPIIILIGH